MKKALIAAAIGILAVVGVVACQSPGAGAKPNGGAVTSTDVETQQYQMQAITGQAGKQLTTAEPYPLSVMRDSAERANVKARLTRLNDPNKVGYVYGMATTGQVMAEWTIRGKVSSTGSQLTNDQNSIGCNSGGQGACGAVVNSMGDDGTFGPEECQGQGVFFFTADSDALVEWCGAWMYSDAPLHLASAPLTVVGIGSPTTPVPAGGTTKK